MPLAEINVGGTGDYGTTVTFASCGSNAMGGAGPCESGPGTESLSVHIWPSDGYYGHFQDQGAVPMKIGGKDGMFDDALNTAGDHAAVQVQPGMLVVFDCGVGVPYVTGSPPQAPTSLKRILASLQWATDPADEANWAPVSDWAK